jgi:ribosomal-protein-alanine N-acetyltransferase
MNEGDRQPGWTIERLSTSDDLDEIVEIERASFSNPWTREMFEWEVHNSGVSHLYVLRSPAHRVAAFCAFWLVLDEIHINNLAVRPDSRRQGTGRMLLEQVLREGVRLGARRATLEVRRSNAAALRLYQGAGFTIAGTRRRYYSNPVEDALVLWREGLSADTAGSGGAA